MISGRTAPTVTQMNPSGNHERRANENDVDDDVDGGQTGPPDALEMFRRAGEHHASTRGTVRTANEDWCDPNPAAALELPPAAHPIERSLARRAEHRRPDFYLQLRRACERLRGLPPKSLTREDVLAFSWHQLTPDDLADYRRDIHKMFNLQSTRNECMVTVRSVVHACAKARLISPLRRDLLLDELPTTMPGRSAKGRALAEDEVGRLLRQCSTTGSAAARTRYTAMIALMYSSGVRVGEVAKLELRDWNRSTSTLTLLHTKNGRDHTVFVHPEVALLLDNWLKVRGALPGALFCSLYVFGFAHMTGPTIRTMVHRRAKDAGLAHFTPHDFRRTFASFMLRTHDHALVSRLLNHEKLQSTLVYDMAGDDLQRDAIASFDLPSSNPVEKDEETDGRR
ncbi:MULTISPECIES: tyrosine-type recombinase/integrase [Mumia]|uniref:tyrosine-type recombinase/integrase n=1 Tax=Mumia TaxID=1546255 RepID=UPI0013D1A6F9|nr:MULTISPECIES: site-specific integrase [Mumia]